MGQNQSNYELVKSTPEKSAPTMASLEDILSGVNDSQKKHMLTEYYRIFILTGSDRDPVLLAVKKMSNMTFQELICHICSVIRTNSNLGANRVPFVEGLKSLILEIKMILKARGEW